MKKPVHTQTQVRRHYGLTHTDTHRHAYTDMQTDRHTHTQTHASDIHKQANTHKIKSIHLPPFYLDKSKEIISAQVTRKTPQ